MNIKVGENFNWYFFKAKLKRCIKPVKSIFDFQFIVIWIPVSLNWWKRRITFYAN